MNIPVCLITDKNLTFATAATIISILENAKAETFYNFYCIINESVCQEDREKILSIKNDYKNCSIEIIDLGNRFSDAKNEHARVTNACLYKMVLAETLPHLDRVIYLDTDLIVRCDLSDLYNMDLKNNYLAGALVVNNWYFKEDSIDRLEIPDLESYVNAGVLLFNLKEMRKDNIEQKLQSHIGEFEDSIDQHTFNKVCYGKIAILDPKYNVRTACIDYYNTEISDIFYPRKVILEAVEAPAIFHWTGRDKPWKYKNLPFAWEWMNYYKKSPYKNKLLKRTNYVQKELKGFAALKKRFNVWYWLFLGIFSQDIRDNNKVLKKLKKSRVLDFLNSAYLSIHNISDYFKYTSNLIYKNKNILLVTHNFSLSGAPLSVFHTANELKKHGYNVTVIGFKDGELLKKYKERNIPAFASKTFNTDNKKFLFTLKKFDFIFANTVLSYNIVKNIYKKKPYIWRICEGKDIETVFFKKYPEIKDMFKKVKKLYSVGENTSEILAKYNDNIELLHYGMDDISENFLKDYKFPTENNKVKFCIIGKWYKRKAQNIVIKAYKLLPKTTKNQIELYFVGTHPLFFQSTSNIHYIGKKVSDEKYRILANCDVLICPSLDDPNPQSVMEGMMMKKPCILSDAVGQAKYVKDGEDAFIVKSGDAASLADVIKKIADDKSLLKNMAPKSYDIFNRYFKTEKYINHVISIIEKEISQD